MDNDDRDSRHGNDAGDAQMVLDGFALEDPRRLARHLPLIEAWLQFCAAQFASGKMAGETLANTRRQLRPWLLYLHDHHVDAPTAAHVATFLAREAGARRPRGLNTVLDYLRLCYRWTASAGRWPDITEGLTDMPVDYPSVPIIERDDFYALLEGVVAKEPLRARNRALLAVLFESGLRPQQLRSRSIDDYAHGCLTGPSTTVTLPRLPQALLDNYLATRAQRSGGDPLFATVGRGERRLSTLSIRLTCLRFFEQAGLVQRHSAGEEKGRLVQPGAWSASCLRRSHLWAAAGATGDAVAAQAVAGHRRKRTTARTLRRCTRSTEFVAVSPELAATLSSLVGPEAG